VGPPDINVHDWEVCQGKSDYSFTGYELVAGRLIPAGARDLSLFHSVQTGRGVH
jgi:hypothetical protein